ISAGPQAWLNRHVLSAKPLVWIGLISYPLYLWHWPLLAYARIIEGKQPSEWVRALAMLAAFVLAWLTYRYAERYLRHTKRRAMTPVLAALMAMVLVFGALVATSKIPGRHSDPFHDEI